MATSEFLCVLRKNIQLKWNVDGFRCGTVKNTRIFSIVIKASELKQNIQYLSKVWERATERVSRRFQKSNFRRKETIFLVVAIMGRIKRIF